VTDTGASPTCGSCSARSASDSGLARKVCAAAPHGLLLLGREGPERMLDAIAEAAPIRGLASPGLLRHVVDARPSSE
jgi:hypothetical protein